MLSIYRSQANSEQITERQFVSTFILNIILFVLRTKIGI